MAHIALTAVTGAEEEHNLLVPAVYDWSLSLIIFLIILVFVWKAVVPKLQKVLDERSEKIEGGIQQAEKAQQEASAALEAYNAQLAEARIEAQRIRDDARAEGTQIVTELRQQATEEARRISEQAQAQIVADRQAAFDQLKSEVGVLSVDLASRVVGQSLTDDQKAHAVVEHFLNDLEKSEAK
ncbi:F0F1 ATP synthase subunit B [Pseudoclavibacter caeni]|uniref:ATP synthase subunit b n=1 Tax=Pseudoclavibacter caeni TaxID=908846 RepID=A0A7C8BNE4_9MICO|nr:F0F1 ATP synthase subunit B [Pseudoclavibacter caeni]KAB1632423.1 F0F1 ATP synthase subunit B [Pseudoclavibacter caeni]NYJ97674.1 F-type H+-transporting ATPase subunit b [Pseudoclavibacter caeni]